MHDHLHSRNFTWNIFSTCLPLKPVFIEKNISLRVFLDSFHEVTWSGCSEGRQCHAPFHPWGGTTNVTPPTNLYMDKNVHMCPPTAHEVCMWSRNGCDHLRKTKIHYFILVKVVFFPRNRFRTRPCFRTHHFLSSEDRVRERSAKIPVSLSPHHSIQMKLIW